MAKPRLLIHSALISLASAAAMVSAQTLASTTTGSTGLAPKFSQSIQRIFQIFGDPWVILFMIFALGWALFYIAFRIGLRQSGTIPTEFQHKLSAVLSFISITPMIWWYNSTKNANVLVKALMEGIVGYGVTLIGTVIVGALLYHGLRWITGERTTH